MSQFIDYLFTSAARSIRGTDGKAPPMIAMQDHRLLAAIVNASDDAILSKTLEGIITTWNPAAERMFGYTAEEILGKSKTLFPPDRLHEEEAIVDRLRQGLPTDHVETVRLHKDGTPLHVSVTISPLKDEDGQVIGASTIARDITERKRAEDQTRRLSAVAAEHDRIAAIIQAIPDIIFLIDRSGVCLECLGGNKPFSSVKEKEVVGKRLCDFVPPHIAALVQCGVQKAFETHAIQSLQYQIHVDGSVGYRDTRIVVQSEDVALVVVRNVSDTKAMEQSLRESDARFQAFINQSSLYAWITDAEGRIQYLSEPYCAMIGRTMAECQNKDAFDLYPAKIAQVMLDNIRLVARTGKTMETVETAPLADGRLHYFLVHKFLMGEMNGRVLVGGSAIDITARVEAEQAIQDNITRQALIIAAQQDILNAGHDLNAMMKCAVERCQNLPVVDGAAVELLDGDELVFSSVAGTASPLLGMRLPLSKTVSGQAMQESRLIYCEDTETCDPFHREIFRRSGLRSLVAVPLLKDGQTIGVLKVVSARPAVFTHADQIVIQLIAGFLSSAMFIAVATRDLRRNEERLNEAQQIACMGSWEKDCITGKINWSEGMFRLYQFDPAEGIPTLEQLMSRIHPDDWKRYQSLLAAAAPAIDKYESDLRLICEDGTVTWGHVVGKLEWNERGEIVRRFGTIMEITAQKQAQIALQEASERLQLATEAAELGVWAYDIVSNALTWDARMMSLYDFTPDTFPGAYKAWSERLHPDDKVRVEAELWNSIAEHKRFDTEFRIVLLDGTIRYIKADALVINSEDGLAVKMIGLNQDITKRKQAELVLQTSQEQVESHRQKLISANAQLEAANAHLAALATTDGLTGANNHRAFQERLREEFVRAERTHRPFSVILLDVDKFKLYNDTFGHPAGDVVLKEVVRVLHDTAREMDFVARYGGEEFVVLLPEIGEAGALEAAERFRAAMEAQEWPLRPITASFGVATLGENTTTAQELIDLADKALYASKEGGRNRSTHAAAL